MKGFPVQISLGLLLLTAGCSSPPVQPFCAAVSEQPADWPALRIAATQISHPLLPPLVFDERDGFSLDELAILAVLNNPDLRTLRHQQNLADAQLLQAGLLPNPKLSIDTARPVGGDTHGAVNAFGLGLGWDLTALLSRSARQDASQKHAGSVALNVAWAEWQVAGAARRSARQLLVVNQRLAAARQIETLRIHMLENVKQKTAAGLGSDRDLFTAETDVQQAQAKRLQAEAAREKTRLLLNRLLGLPAAQPVALENGTNPSMKRPLPADLLSRDVANRRLDLLALKLGYESQEARVRAAVRSQFPSITIGWSTGRETDGVKTIGAGVSIDLPFFDRNQGVIAKERATQQMLRDEYRARLFAARSDIARLTAQLHAADKEATLLATLQASRVAQLAGLRRAVETGQSDMADYDRARISLYTGRIHQADLEETTVDLNSALETVCGGFRPAHLRESSVQQENIK